MYVSFGSGFPSKATGSFPIQATDGLFLGSGKSLLIADVTIGVGEALGASGGGDGIPERAAVAGFDRTEFVGWFYWIFKISISESTFPGMKGQALLFRVLGLAFLSWEAFS